MFWFRNKKINCQLRTFIWGPGALTAYLNELFCAEPQVIGYFRILFLPKLLYKDNANKIFTISIYFSLKIW